MAVGRKGLLCLMTSSYAGPEPEEEDRTCTESANAVSNEARLQDALVPVLLSFFLALVPNEISYSFCVRGNVCFQL